jgi:putative proteasome-type protease
VHQVSIEPGTLLAQIAGSESLTARKVATYQISARERLFKLVNLDAAQVRRIAAEDAKPLEDADLHFNIHSLIGGPGHALSDHRQFGIREADSGTQADARRPDSVCVQAGCARVRCDAAVRFECRYERADLNQISSWWQERMRCAVDELPSKWVEAAFSKLSGSGP